METEKTTDTNEVCDQHLLLPCPFCGTQPVRKIVNNILSVTCPHCVSIGFHNHVRLGCQADAEWNERLAQVVIQTST